jgi:DNA modification methylase
VHKEIIGNATLYLGDCREVLPAIRADAVITDPPYGIGVALGVSSKGSDGGMWAKVKIAGDETTQVRDDALQLTGYAKAHAVFASHKAPMPDGFKDLLIWDKGEHTGAGNLEFPWKPCFELVWVKGEWKGRRTSAVLRFLAIAGCVGNRNDGHRYHPTEKPVKLMEHFVDRCQGVVLDPFMGSASTGVACVNLGRPFIGIECDKAHFQTACDRIEAAYAQQRLFA